MTLKDCTKGELIEVVEQLRRLCGDYYVESALDTVERQRENRKAEKENQLLAVMKRTGEEIDRLYLPYKDDHYCHVPDGIIAKAKALAREYDEAYSSWRRLMGIDPKK